MTTVGIEALNVYAGEAFIEVADLFTARGLDTSRMDNLMMKRKSVSLHCEDAVSCAVNAARPLVDALTDEQRAGIQLVIVGTESGIDFGKSLATYVHDLLGLHRGCRLLEVKQACYAGTAAMQLAASVVAASPARHARALVIATDVARPVPNTYVEPSQGAGAVAAIVSREPVVARLDWGANGFHSYEVMDTCRPAPDVEAGDVDLSVLTYIDCLYGAWSDYLRKVRDADPIASFDLLAMHTPFPGMVRGAHAAVLRRLLRLPRERIESDFTARLLPSLRYPQLVGNLYTATALLALASTIDNAEITGERRVGVFAYGSGCSSEFYSCVVSPDSVAALGRMGIGRALDARYRLSPAEYDEILAATAEIGHSPRDYKIDVDRFGHILHRQLAGRQRLVLTAINNYHREYAWIGS